MTDKEPEFYLCDHCKQDKPFKPMGICGYCLGHICADCLKANPCKKAGKQKAIKYIGTSPPIALD